MSGSSHGQQENRARTGLYLSGFIYVVFVTGSVFVYPWAVAFGRLGTLALIGMAVFLGILALGLLYAWKEGALRWR